MRMKETATGPSRATMQLLALSGIVAISFSAILVRLADVTPTTATFFRALYGLPALLLIWSWGRRNDHRGPRRRTLAFAAGGLLALDLSLWHQSIGWIGAGLATVLANTQIVFVALLGWLVYRRKLLPRQVLLIPVVLAGIGLVSGLGRTDAYGERPVAGALLGVAAGVTYAFFLFVYRAASRDGGPAAGPLLDATAGAAMAGLVLGAAHGTLDLTVHFPAHGWLMLLGVGCQAAGWLLITRALPGLPEIEVSVLLLLQPVGTVIWASLLFGESLALSQLAGAATVLASVFAMSFPGRKPVVVIREYHSGPMTAVGAVSPVAPPALACCQEPAHSGEIRLDG